MLLLALDNMMLAPTCTTSSLIILTISVRTRWSVGRAVLRVVTQAYQGDEETTLTEPLYWLTAVISIPLTITWQSLTVLLIYWLYTSIWRWVTSQCPWEVKVFSYNSKVCISPLSGGNSLCLNKVHICSQIDQYDCHFLFSDITKLKILITVWKEIDLHWTLEMREVSYNFAIYHSWSTVACTKYSTTLNFLTFARLQASNKYKIQVLGVFFGTQSWTKFIQYFTFFFP